MTPKTPTEAAFHAIVRTSVLLRRCMEPYFVRFGITGAQWGVLRTLKRAEDEGLDGIRISELRDRLLVRMPSVTTVVARLEQMGLLLREVPPDDHRARSLRLTQAGQALVGRVLAGHGERIESLLAPLGMVQRADLAGLLGRVADRLAEIDRAELHPGESDEDSIENVSRNDLPTRSL